MRRHTRLLPVPDVPGIRLHVADDVMLVMQRAGSELGQADPALPFWAFAWAGGLAVARYLVDHPEEVAGRDVLDVASGSGLCGITALRCGAASAHAIDIDPFAEAAVATNARANGVRLGFSRQDIAGLPTQSFDVILAGDVCYEEAMAIGIVDWLRSAARNGARVLLGDPGRAYLPTGLERLATYRVQTSRELESSETRESTVYTFSGDV